MHAIIFIILLLPSLLSLAYAQNYKLGSGDIISIRVYNEPSLTFDNILLTDDGTIIFPFLGIVSAQGKTISELRNQITSGLKAGYLKTPYVTVNLKKYRDFYVSGAVTHPGNYQFQPGMTLRKALAIAGGLDKRASDTKIFVIKGNDSAKKEQIITMESSVNPGDTIIAREGFF